MIKLTKTKFTKGDSSTEIKFEVETSDRNTAVGKIELDTIGKNIYVFFNSIGYIYTASDVMDLEDAIITGFVLTLNNVIVQDKFK